MWYQFKNKSVWRCSYNCIKYLFSAPIHKQISLDHSALTMKSYGGLGLPGLHEDVN